MKQCHEECQKSSQVEETELEVCTSQSGSSSQDRGKGRRKLHKERSLKVCRGYLFNIQLNTVSACVIKKNYPKQGINHIKGLEGIMLVAHKDQEQWKTSMMQLLKGLILM